MGGRELRAALIFVLLSTAGGMAFRGWQRAHHERFDAIVESLVTADRDGGALGEPNGEPATAPGGESAARSGSTFREGEGTGRSRPGRRRESAAPPRPASIDVDRAGAAELMRLPGIGPALAARILAAREREPFGTPEGLLRVPGIGPKTLAKIRPYLAPTTDSLP